MSKSNSTSASEDMLSECNQSEYKKHKSRAALYTDNERLRIIEEIYKRRFLWDIESREATSVSPNVRKQTFSEIANQVSAHTHNNTLKGEDVLAQWKNLRDTYIKIRKKLPITDGGTPTLPRWRFYRLLQFIDPNEKVTRSFDFQKELATVRNAQRKPNASSSKNTSTSVSQFNNSVTVSNSVSKTSRPIMPNLVTTTVIPQLNQLNSRLKRPSDTTLTYVRHNSVSQFKVETNHVPSLVASEQQVQSSTKEVRLTPPTNGATVNGLSNNEDEYVTFCNSLIHPLREIGTHNRLDYINFQKLIHDTLFEIQSKIHSKTMIENGSK